MSTRANPIDIPVDGKHIAGTPGRARHDADHALSDKAWQQTYTSLLVNWMSEMVLGARAGKTGTAALAPPADSVQPTPRAKD
jgi:hypothetical protein